MAELIKLGLGDSTKISVKLVPVFIPSIKILKLTGGPAEHPTVTESLKSFECLISMGKASCSISSDIKNVELRWVFRRSDKVEIISYLDPGKITLSRSETSDTVRFQAKNIGMPLASILIDNITKLAGNTGTISVRLSIDELPLIEIIPDMAIEWDFSYSILATIKDKDNAIKPKAFILHTIGARVSIKFNKGKSFPTSYNYYLIIWENNAWPEIDTYYSCEKLNEDVYFKGKYTAEVQSTVITLFTSTNLNYFLGCTLERKLSYGINKGDMKYFYFNSLFIIASNLNKIITTEYKQINILPPYVISGIDVFYAPCPVLSIIRDKPIKDGKAMTYTVTLTIKNISSKINSAGKSFSLMFTGASGTYSSDNPSMHTASEEVRFQIISPPVLQSNPYDDSDTCVIQSSIKIRFTAPKDLYVKEFILVFPLVDLVADWSKDCIPQMISNLYVSGISLKKEGDLYKTDTEKKYQYIGVTII